MNDPLLPASQDLAIGGFVPGQTVRIEEPGYGSTSVLADARGYVVVPAGNVVARESLDEWERLTRAKAAAESSVMSVPALAPSMRPLPFAIVLMILALAAAAFMFAVVGG